jgi:hypothetical protein
MDDIAVGIEDLDKAAHVGAFEFVRQIDEHADGGDGILERALLVADLDGKPEAADADFIDAQLAVIAFALFIVHRFGPGGAIGRMDIHGDKSVSLSHRR